MTTTIPPTTVSPQGKRSVCAPTSDAAVRIGVPQIIFGIISIVLYVSPVFVPKENGDRQKFSKMFAIGIPLQTIIIFAGVLSVAAAKKPIPCLAISCVVMGMISALVGAAQVVWACIAIDNAVNGYQGKGAGYFFTRDSKPKIGLLILGLAAVIVSVLQSAFGLLVMQEQKKNSSDSEGVTLNWHFDEPTQNQDGNLFFPVVRQTRAPGRLETTI